MLHEDLRNYVVQNRWQMIHHPLIIEPIYHEMNDDFINKHYECKLKMLDDAKKEGDWESYVFLHERPYRAEAFGEIVEELDDKRYWELLGIIFVDSENVFENDLASYLLSGRKQREYLMNEEERSFLAELPERNKIYRGHQGINRDGISYSLDRDVAEKFARRYGANGEVLEREVHRDDVFAVFLGRQEKEVIVF